MFTVFFTEFSAKKCRSYKLGGKNCCFLISIIMHVGTNYQWLLKRLERDEIDITSTHHLISIALNVGQDIMSL